MWRTNRYNEERDGLNNIRLPTNMAESWSSARQALVYAESPFTFGSDRSTETSGAIRTYTESLCQTAGFIFSGTAIWCFCIPENPAHTDRVCKIDSLYRADTTVNALCFQDTSVVFCTAKAIDDSGPVVLSYPKYYNDPTMPPDFDVVFRVYSSAPIEWTSLVVSVAVTSGESKSYGASAVTKVRITDEITEVRLLPSGINAASGDTVTVSLYLKDSYGRAIQNNW